MKALVLTQSSTFELQDIPRPDPDSNEVLIRVKACGICGSDVHGMDGSTGRRQPPVIMGHEAAGIIEGTGENVKQWKRGDRVTFDSTIFCNNCEYCNRGAINLCNQRRVLGVSCDDYRQNGAFAEYISVPEHILYKVPDKISFEQAAMVEPATIAMHAIHLAPDIRNARVAVIGSGMIGLFVIQCLKAVGCEEVIAMDTDESKLRLAEELGADKTLNASQLSEHPAIEADIAFEVVGITPALQSAVAALRKGGTLIMIGNVSAYVDLPLQSVVTRQLKLLGSCASSGEYPECLQLIADGLINTDLFISSVAPLADGPQWFDRLYKKEQGLMKVILTP